MKRGSAVLPIHCHLSSLVTFSNLPSDSHSSHPAVLQKQHQPTNTDFLHKHTESSRSPHHSRPLCTFIHDNQRQPTTTPLHNGYQLEDSRIERAPSRLHLRLLDGRKWRKGCSYFPSHSCLLYFTLPHVPQVLPSSTDIVHTASPILGQHLLCQSCMCLGMASSVDTTCLRIRCPVCCACISIIVLTSGRLLSITRRWPSTSGKAQHMTALRDSFVYSRRREKI